MRVLKNRLYLLSLAIITAIYALVMVGNISERFNDYLYDIFSNLKYENSSKLTKTVVVEIDQKSIEKLGQWPWSRLIVANIIRNISKSNPTALGIDILFSEQDRTSPSYLQTFYNKNLGLDVKIENIPDILVNNDTYLADTIKHSNTVLSIIATNTKTPTACKPKIDMIFDKDIDMDQIFETPYFMCNIKEIENSVHSVGFVNAFLNSNGFLRKYKLFMRDEDRLIPSLGVAMLSLVDKNIKYIKTQDFVKNHKLKFLDHDIWTDNQSDVLNYFYPSQRFNVVSAVDILSSDFDSKIFTGKFVFLGVNATGLSDKYISSNNDETSGVFAHASFIENALGGKTIFTLSICKPCLIFLSFLTILILSLLVVYKKYIESNIIFFAVLVSLISLSWIGLDLNIYFPIMHFLIPLSLSYFIILIFLSFILYKEEKEFAINLMSARSSIVNNMMTIVETRDIETGNHIIRVKKYTKLLTEYLAKNSKYADVLDKKTINIICETTPLHDVGKVGIPDSILKKPGKLTDEEMNIMKTHSIIGRKIIKTSNLKDDIGKLYNQISINIAYAHHEKWDGTGYPQGLKGEDIPLEARIVALADVYDALISSRCYKEAFSFERAENIIIDSSGTHFDPMMVEAFVKLKDKFREVATAHND